LERRVDGDSEKEGDADALWLCGGHDDRAEDFLVRR
jgi:hypothetical protein